MLWRQVTDIDAASIRRGRRCGDDVINTSIKNTSIRRERRHPCLWELRAMGGQLWLIANINKHCTRKLVLCRDRISDETFNTSGPNLVGYWAPLLRLRYNSVVCIFGFWCSSQCNFIRTTLSLNLYNHALYWCTDIVWFFLLVSVYANNNMTGNLDNSLHTNVESTSGSHTHETDYRTDY